MACKQHACDGPERVVTGTIRDESGSPMPGVNVIVGGTSNGTVSDTSGKYSISVGSGTRLLFSFIGYISQEVEVGSSTTIDVSLKVDVTELSEIVVTGYTTEKKADIIGSVAVINSKDLLSNPVPNLSQQLQGRASGVIASGSGAPGEGAKIRIRGFSSFGNADPLYVIDGVPTKDASRVNPNDVESVQVLKDATSASIYGARAANGVIIVTTKQGKNGSIKVDYDGFVGPSGFLIVITQSYLIPRNIANTLLASTTQLQRLPHFPIPCLEVRAHFRYQISMW